MTEKTELIISQIEVKQDKEVRNPDFYSIRLSKKGELKRGFSIIIGIAEIQSITLRINNKRPIRPLTHDLLISILHEFNTTLTKVEIYKLHNNHFYSYLYLIQPNGKELVIDARTSDAIALAVKTDVPIYIHTNLFEQVSQYDEAFVPGINIHKRDEPNHTPTNTLEEMSNSEIEQQIKQAIEKENYEWATTLRDELNRRRDAF